MSNKHTVLAWVDLETTGLRPASAHRILEYAFIFTDLHLNELGRVTGLIDQDVRFAISLMDSFAFDMHTKNGLLDELRHASNYQFSLDKAQQDILRVFYEVHGLASDHEVEVIFVPAGNTVGFDKEYLQEHMPDVFKKFHYRQLDVSAYKVAFPESFGTQTSDAHRAVDDIEASIESHRKMREIFLTGQHSLSMKSATRVETTFDEDDCC